MTETADRPATAPAGGAPTARGVAPQRRAFDIQSVRADFPVISAGQDGKPLAFLDSAASAQKPQSVLDAERRSYSRRYANVHRGIYRLSQQATADYEAARAAVRRFLNAAEDREIVFTKGATQAINLVAHSFGALLQPGDEVVLTEMEHHSNIVPWQMLRDRAGITLRVAEVTPDGRLPLENLEAVLSTRTKLVAVTHMSNVLGTVVDARRVAELAHSYGAAVLFDGCQAICHTAVDVRAIDADFYVFSGHKIYGPTGIGVLYGKAGWLERMPPFEGGGDMIDRVTFETTTYADPPAKFEAGTPPIAQAVALHSALAYVDALGVPAIEAHESDLLAYATQQLEGFDGLTLYGRAPDKAAVLSFTLDGIQAQDVATLLDKAHVCVRVGHHCAQPLMDKLGITATVRASLGLYNTRADIDQLVSGLQKVQRIFG